MSLVERFERLPAVTHSHLLPLAVPDERASQVKWVVFDFDGVFTDNGVWISETGEESVRCSRADGFGLKLLREVGIGFCVLSSEVNPVVGFRCKKLGIDCHQGYEDKTEHFRRIVEAQGVSLEAVAYVGNDINDISCLQLAGVAVVVQDAYLAAAQAARYQTQRPGGYGAVREVCEWLAACQLAPQRDSLS